MNIIKWPNSGLSNPTVDVTDSDNIRDIVTQMFSTMDAMQGVGLAAPQVDVHKSIIVVDTGNIRTVMINPKIVSFSKDSVLAKEGCLSIPGVRVSIPRYSVVNIEWQDVDGEEFAESFRGFDARVIQHEIDHLNGITLWERLSPIHQERHKKKFDKVRKKYS